MDKKEEKTKAYLMNPTEKEIHKIRESIHRLYTNYMLTVIDGDSNHFKRYLTKCIHVIIENYDDLMGERLEVLRKEKMEKKGVFTTLCEENPLKTTKSDSPTLD
jgi:hypothetical protein